VIEIGYALSVAEPLTFTLQRVGADRRYLGRDGLWRNEIEGLKPRQVESRDGKTLLKVGPEIVDRLGEDERLRLEIAAASFAVDLVWSGVAPSSGKVGSSVFARRAAAPPESPTPEPVPELLPEPLAEPLAELPPEPPPRSGKRLLGALLAVLVVVLVAGAIAGWHYRQQLVTWLHPLKDGGREGTADDDRRLGQELKSLIEAPDGDAGRILDGGRRLINSASRELREIGFRAIDVAAFRGSASAQLDMGKLYDPRSFKAGRGGMEKASVSTAAEWYRRARESGSQEAVGELRDLCAKIAEPSDEIDNEERLSTVSQYCH
jgi:hypothetical protein